MKLIESEENSTTTIATIVATNVTSQIGTNAGCEPNSATAFLATENLYIGILFASKPIVQTLTNMAVGPITDLIGFNVPMFAGYVIMFSSATSKNCCRICSRFVIKSSVPLEEGWSFRIFFLPKPSLVLGHLTQLKAIPIFHFSFLVA